MREDQPEPRSALDREGVPEVEEAYPGEAATGVRWDEMVPPGDEPAGVEEFGITASEERADEPLALRVLREEPDVGTRGAAQARAQGLAGDDDSPRLVDPDQGGMVDDEPDAVAAEVDDADALSPEEAAVHVTGEDDAPGLTLDAGPGYLDDEPGG